MAIRKLTNAAYLATNWQDEVESKNDLKKGHINIKIDKVNKLILAGSTLETNGVIYSVDTDASVSNPTLNTENTLYMYFRDIAGVFDFYFSEGAPAYDQVKGGFYHKTNTTWRAVARLVNIFEWTNLLSGKNFEEYMMSKRIDFAKNLTNQLNLNWSVDSYATNGTNHVIILNSVLYYGSGTTSYSVDNNTHPCTYTTSITGQSLQKVKYVNNKYFAFGVGSKYLWSSDGVTWTEGTLTTSTTWRDVVYASSKYVFINGTTTINWSSDGATSWTAATASESVSYIATNGTKFVGCPSTTTTQLTTSTDAITWTDVGTISSSYNISDFQYLNSKFILAANGRGWYSSDGTTWSTYTGVQNEISKISFLNSKYYGYGSTFIYSSTDLATWTKVGVLPISSYSAHTSQVNSTDYYIASDHSIYLTVDGINFIKKFLPYSGILGIKKTITGQRSSTSSDWLKTIILHDSYVEYSLGMYSGDNSLNLILFQTISDTKKLTDITKGSDKYVICQQNTNTVWYSTIGTSTAWTVSNALPSTSNWSGVAWNGSRYALISNGSTAAAYSSDGITWSATTMPSAAAWSSITYGNGRFVAVAGGTTSSAWSSDGITWNAVTLPITSATYINVVYGDEKFVVPGSTAACCWSSDGITWNSFSPSTTNMNNLCYYDGIWMSGISTAILYSIDLLTWRYLIYKTGSINKGSHFLIFSDGDYCFTTLSNSTE